MYIQRYNRTKNGKQHQSVFLVESYREDGKVKHRHLANLSALPQSAILAIENELKGIKPPKENTYSLEEIRPLQGKNCGAIISIMQLAKRLGISTALGNTKEGKLALLQIMGRIICQGSRLHIASQWAATQALEEVIDMGFFNEDSLYENLSWLCDNQERIENTLFKHRHKEKKIQSIYLYDVTSSYLEGTYNELAAYGYNRDGKKGKMQIVVGLLCDNEGYPISVEVFEGNTQDSTTVAAQLVKLQKRFGIKDVIMVGDRGMIKSAAIDTINDLNWYYITAITKPQLEKLLKQDVLQLSLFTDQLMEVQADGIRYVLRRNPQRAGEIQASRTAKLAKVKVLIEAKNKYLALHPKAKPEVALKAVETKVKQLKIQDWIILATNDRMIEITMDEVAQKEAATLDGCYVIKTNVPNKNAEKEIIHQRYKDLALVESAFRTFKQSFEELRPIYLRRADRTKGHVFICMLAYIIIKYTCDQCKDLDITHKQIFRQLDEIQYTIYNHKNIQLKVLPKELRQQTNDIINKLNIKLPDYL